MIRTGLFFNIRLEPSDATARKRGIPDRSGVTALPSLFALALCFVLPLLSPPRQLGAAEPHAEPHAEPPHEADSIAAGLAPAEAAARMSVPAGFRVQLAAGEPQVHQPIAFAIDHRGRIWLAEAHTYPIRAADGKGRDKIIILEDTDQDGTLDSSRLFLDGLNLVSGLEVGFGGVWVGAAPYLMFIPDRDQDDVPDSEPEILLDGFGYEDTHETLNSFVWGPDGWLYGCHGIFTHSRVGPPGTGPQERVPLNAGVWRFHPTRRQFEVFAWGTSNPWGVDFNDRGEAFCTACVIPHLYHVIQGARYQRQAGQHFNPYVFDDIKTIADHLHYEGNIRDHAWWGQEPIAPSSTLKAGGGHAHCGAMVYLGGQWPQQYHNQLLFHNVHGNRVNMDVLVPSGSGYRGQHGKDFLLANDRWFRGINLKYGPDGGVYLIDWYDPNACHRRNPEIWDRTNGRIYKVSYPAGTQPSPAAASLASLDLSQLGSAELVELQRHPNAWFARTARRLLQERGANPELHARLIELIADAGNPLPQRLRGLWTLHLIRGLTDDLVTSCLQDQEPSLRGWAIRLRLEANSEASSADTAFVAQLADLAETDPSPVVRRYLASALQRLPHDQRWEIVEPLLSHAADADDHNLPWLYWYAAEPLVAADPVRALDVVRAGKIPLVYEYALRRAAANDDSLPQVVSELAAANSDRERQTILAAMLAGFQGRADIGMPPSWQRTAAPLYSSRTTAVRDLAEQVAVTLGDQRIFPRLRATLTDPAASAASRLRALQILLQGRDQEAAAAVQSVLTEPALSEPALKALATLHHPATPQAILQHYGAFDDSAKRAAVTTLVGRPEFAMQLLDAVEAEQVPRTDLHAYHVRQLLGFDSSELAQRLRAVWGEVRSTSQDKRQVIEQHKAKLTRAAIARADRSEGRQIFRTNCAACHQLFDDGSNVGPDITGSNRADLDYILSNIVDPSSVLGKDYRMSVFVMADGRVVSGLIQQETASAVTVRTINDTLLLPKSEIDERQLSDQSLMPERLLEPLSEEQVANLVAYLASPAQVPLPE